MSEQQKPYKVKVNDFEFFFDEADLAKADLIDAPSGGYNLIKQNRSLNTSVTHVASHAKKMRVEVDGENYDVEIKTELDQMLDKMGFSATATKVLKEIKAPMPGLVLTISVEEGQEVKEGERLLILEAMKMENSIVIHANAKIKKINVKPGQAVDKGQVLVELD